MIQETCKKLYEITEENMNNAGEELGFPGEVCDFLLSQPMFTIDLKGVWDTDSKLFIHLMCALFLYRSAEQEILTRYEKLNLPDDVLKRNLYYDVLESEEFLSKNMEIVNRPQIDSGVQGRSKKRLRRIYRKLKGKRMMQVYQYVKDRHPAVVKLKDAIKFWLVGGIG